RRSRARFAANGNRSRALDAPAFGQTAFDRQDARPFDDPGPHAGTFTRLRSPERFDRVGYVPPVDDRVVVSPARLLQRLSCFAQLLDFGIGVAPCVLLTFNARGRAVSTS